MIGSMIIASMTANEVKSIVAGVLMCIIAALSIALIVLVLLQRGTGDNVSAITGGSNKENFFAKTKGGSKQRTLRLLTIIFSSVIAVLAIVFFAIVPYTTAA